jgi:hypothetical protein
MRSAAEALYEEQSRVDRIERQLDEREGALTAAQRTELAAIKKRAAPVFAAVTHSVPNPADKPIVYRVKLATMLQRHAKGSDWARTDLANLARGSPAAFANVEDEIYKTAYKNGLDPSYRGDAPRGQLRERIEVDQAGRETTVFHGDIRSWIDMFTTPVVAAVERWKK